MGLNLRIRLRLRLRPRLAHTAFQHCQPVHYMAERAVHSFKRTLRARQIALQAIHLRRYRCRTCAALVFNVHQEVGEAAFDRFKLADACAGGVKLLHQVGEAVLEITEGHVIGARILQALDLVGQTLDQRFELRRHAAAVLNARFESIGNVRDTLIKNFQGIAVVHTTDTGSGHLINLLGQRMHLSGQLAQRLVGNAAHRRNVGFKLLERARVRRRTTEHVDLLRQAVDRFAEAVQSLSRPERRQRFEDFRQSALNGGERVGVQAGMAAVVEAGRERADFAFQRFDSTLRHGIQQRVGDLAQSLLQVGNALLELRLLPQRLDLTGDVTQLLFQPGEVLYRHWGGLCGRLGLHGRSRLGVRALRSENWRIRLGVERLHPRGDFRHSLIDVRRPAIGGRGRRRLGHVDRRGRRINRRAIHWLCRDRTAGIDQFVHSPFEASDGLRQLAVAVVIVGQRGICLRPSRGWRIGRARCGRLMQPLELASQFVEAFMYGEKLVAIVVVAAGRHPAFLGGVANDRAEPFAHRHAGAVRGFPRRLARIGTIAFHFPRNAQFHAHAHVAQGGAESPMAQLNQRA